LAHGLRCHRRMLHPGAACARPGGIAFLRATPGRNVGRKCVAQTKRNRAKPRCTRFVPAGTLKFTGHAGLNKVAFQGHITTRKKLPLGTYTLSITATNAAGQKSAPKALRFKIVKR
jgi:hypothetical protein